MVGFFPLWLAWRGFWLIEVTYPVINTVPTVIIEIVGGGGKGCGIISSIYSSCQETEVRDSQIDIYLTRVRKGRGYDVNSNAHAVRRRHIEVW